MPQSLEFLFLSIVQHHHCSPAKSESGQITRLGSYGQRAKHCEPENLSAWPRAETSAIVCPLLGFQWKALSLAAPGCTWLVWVWVCVGWDGIIGLIEKCRGAPLPSGSCSPGFSFLDRLHSTLCISYLDTMSGIPWSDVQFWRPICDLIEVQLSSHSYLSKLWHLAKCMSEL